MSDTPYTRFEILTQLDACARSFVFPMLDNAYVYPADVRLNAYRDPARWALIIEALGANSRAAGYDGLANCLYCFGNCLYRPAGTANSDFLFPVGDGEHETFDEEYSWYVNPDVVNVRIRDHLIPVDLDVDTLMRKGIELTEEGVAGQDLLRSLLPEHRDRLLAIEEELRQRLPPDLPLILRLDEWHHPTLMPNDMPSDSPTFQMIADVLVTGDPGRYRPTLPPNTDWRNWPEGGTL